MTVCPGIEIAICAVFSLISVPGVATGLGRLNLLYGQFRPCYVGYSKA